jgi:ADP-ribose pyrophosphatase YjhB (NUDIX family)
MGSRRVAEEKFRRSLRHRLFHAYFLLRRPMTLGVRAVVLDEAGQSVLLVRHTYVDGWHLPGGGVERGESVHEALVKELREEANIVLAGNPELFGIYRNLHASARDHVVLFVCRSFRQTAPRKSDHEIAEAGFFSLAMLPPDTTGATRRRLGEVVGGADIQPLW